MSATLGILAWMAAAPALAQAAANPCFGTVDYSDEIDTSTSTLGVTSTPIGGGFVQLTVSGLEIHNRGIGWFDAAEVRPDLTGFEVGRVTPATFGQLDPGREQRPTDLLTIEVAAHDEAALTKALEAKTIPLRVFADEVPQPHDDVEIFAWDEALDDAYDLASSLDAHANPDPGEGPWPHGEQYTLAFAVFGDELPPALEGFDKNAPRHMVGQNYRLEHTPTPFYTITFDAVDIDDTVEPTWIEVTARITANTDMRDVYATASFCADTGVDWPVRETRLPEVDGEERTRVELNTRTSPVWFEERTLIPGITFTGQIHAQAMKPELVMRIREREVLLRVGLHSEVSFAGEVRAGRLVEDGDEMKLFGLCYPLPNIPLGVVELEQDLCTDQYIYAEVELRAGMAVSIAKRLGVSATMDCTLLGDGAPACDAPQVTLPEPPLSLSPPELTLGLTANAELGTRLDVSWRVTTMLQPPIAAVHGTISTEIYGVFDADVSRDPWWTIGHGARLGGSLGASLLGKEVGELEITFLEPPPRIDLEAPGALLRGASSATRYASGEDLRWLLAVDDVGRDNNRPEHVDVALFSDGGVVAVAEDVGAHRVVATDRFGELRWSQRYAAGYKPRAVHVLPDDTVLVAGHPTFLAAHDPQGNLLWSKEYDVVADNGDQRCAIWDMAPYPDENGDQVVLVGEFSRGLVTEDDGCMLVVDAATGSVDWSMLYVRPGMLELEGVTATRDGDIVAVGRFDTAAAILRLDGLTGQPRWSRIAPMPGARGAELFDVAEGADGTLLAVGQSAREIRLTGAAYALSVDPLGENAVHGMILHDAAPVHFSDEPVVVASDTAYDIFHEVVAVDDGFVAAGHSGAHGDTGWLVKMSPRLGVEWFTALDGESASGLTSVRKREDALVVGGISSSANAVGPSLTDSALVVGTVPFDGNLLVHPSFAHMQMPLLTAGVRSGEDPDDIAPVVLIDLGSLTTEVPTVTVTDNDRLLIAPTTECALMMTVTGHPTGGDGCAPQPDIYPPTIAILQPKAALYPWSSDLPVLVELDDAASYEVTLNGAPITIDAVLELSALGVGAHTLAVEATDEDGNVAFQDVMFTVFDDEPPTVAILSPEPRAYQRDQEPVIPITIDATDGATEVVDVAVTLRGRPFDLEEIPVAALPIGPAELVVVVTDAAGNEAEATVTFEVAGPRPACGCTSTGVGGYPLALVLLAALARRRRPRSSSASPASQPQP